LHLSYDGGAYHGWQKQPNAITVQETLEKALSTYTRQEVFLTGQGRTDTGVHATCFYAHWDFKEGEAWPWEGNPEVWLARGNWGTGYPTRPLFGLVKNLSLLYSLEQGSFFGRALVVASCPTRLGGRDQGHRSFAGYSGFWGFCPQWRGSKAQPL
jgi:hypothetical protein